MTFVPIGDFEPRYDCCVEAGRGHGGRGSVKVGGGEVGVEPVGVPVVSVAAVVTLGGEGSGDDGCLVIQDAADFISSAVSSLSSG